MQALHQIFFSLWHCSLLTHIIAYLHQCRKLPSLPPLFFFFQIPPADGLSVRLFDAQSCRFPSYNTPGSPPAAYARQPPWRGVRTGLFCCTTPVRSPVPAPPETRWNWNSAIRDAPPYKNRFLHVSSRFCLLQQVRISSSCAAPISPVKTPVKSSS